MEVIHTIKEIQDIEWNREAHDTAVTGIGIMSAIAGGVATIATINAIQTGRVQDAIGVGVSLGSIGILGIITAVIDRKRMSSNIMKLRRENDLSEETEKGILEILASNGDTEGKKLLMSHKYLRGISDGSYTVEYDRDRIVLSPTSENSMESEGKVR